MVAPLDGAVYGQPLVVGGTVFAATENDTVYALDPVTGKAVWQSHLGTPVPRSALPCGERMTPRGTSTLSVLCPGCRASTEPVESET